MVNSKLINYIKTEEAQGYSAHQLHDFLLKKGFSETDIDDAITYANKKDITTTEQQTGFENSLENIKRRNAVVAFFLTAITLGLYGVVWFMMTTAELRRHQQHAPSAILGVLLFAPYLAFLFLFQTLDGYYFLYGIAPLLGLIISIFIFRPYLRSLTRLTGGNPGVLLTLLILVFPFGVLATQEELNKRAHYK